MSETTYTAVVTTTGEGRNGGRAVSSDGALDLNFAIPKELGGNGGATNPEQLLAAGWSSCFMGAVRIAAAQRKVKLADLAVVADVTLHHDEANFWLSAALHLELTGIDQETADALAAAAHQNCPYSKALGGSIEVTVDATVA
ncbi:Ohr family peroxiredoxin [Amycolatopsis sp. FU40]|uniref:Ohr family peroxiredoxin n=1 Tax=Amycolatopsis sp. FU40 TaxID=2914159 RepID=UPI001F001964|nr:Ohr family peroxiredoxin [Amycolatopsis sp. FU40]UKD56268.1 Ohr family peroxiredoxin [Amycolatopsis sp. FU40]